MTYFDPDSRKPLNQVPKGMDNEGPSYELMLKELRSWGFGQIGIGAISLIASSFLSPAWGIMLISVGLASFFIKDAAMFIIYGVTVIWAAIANGLNGLNSPSWGWAGFSLMQIYFAVRVLRNYARFRRAQNERERTAGVEGKVDPGPGRARRLFPPAGCALSALAALALSASVVTIVVAGFLGTKVPSDFIYVGLEIVVDLAVLGLALGIASLLSHFPLRVLSILGVAGSAFILIGYLVIGLMP